jgi:hypothetical protein
MLPLFAFPKQCKVGRVVPKSKIYSYGKLSRSIQQRFVDEVDQIVWAYKLAPETINLPPSEGISEIQIFQLMSKSDELNDALTRAIDQSIVSPIFFEVVFRDRVKVIAAYKRPSDVSAKDRVIDCYFHSDWLTSDSERSQLPVALTLGELYEQMLRRLLPAPSRPGETLREQVERIKEMEAIKSKCNDLEQRLRRQKQFNRKVPLNEEIKLLRKRLDSLLT